MCREYNVSLILGIGLIFWMVSSAAYWAGNAAGRPVGGIASLLFLEKRSGVLAQPSAVIEGQASSKKLTH